MYAGHNTCELNLLATRKEAESALTFALHWGYHCLETGQKCYNVVQRYVTLPERTIRLGALKSAAETTCQAAGLDIA
ncbi:hypothetical protein IQ22_01532 [Pseudomonas duriflava]|uniref:Uncharacterized protein n=1 Tax=Pseudomonas duriflava TaxID=459528 RepID=A0A562QHS9_9PSED|nr:hypothetical protein IQ22_01532 [Pseudomonas duriflava]